MDALMVSPHKPLIENSPRVDDLENLRILERNDGGGDAPRAGTSLGRDFSRDGGRHVVEGVGDSDLGDVAHFDEEKS